MSRPSDGDRITTAVRIPASLHERLTAEATDRDVSLNLLVVKAIDRYLDQLVPVDEATRTRDEI